MNEKIMCVCVCERGREKDCSYFLIMFEMQINFEKNVFINKKVKSATGVEGDLDGSLFNSYYTKVLGRDLPLDCSTLPLIRALYCWVLIKEVSSTIFKVFGMTWVGIEPRSPGPLANTLSTRPISQFYK